MRLAQLTKIKSSPSVIKVNVSEIFRPRLLLQPGFNGRSLKSGESDAYTREMLINPSSFLIVTHIAFFCLYLYINSSSLVFPLVFDSDPPLNHASLYVPHLLLRTQWSHEEEPGPQRWESVPLKVQLPSDRYINKSCREWGVMATAEQIYSVSDNNSS